MAIYFRRRARRVMRLERRRNDAPPAKTPSCLKERVESIGDGGSSGCNLGGRVVEGEVAGGGVDMLGDWAKAIDWAIQIVCW